MSSTTLLATDQQCSVLITLKANHSPQPIGYSPYGYRPAECGLLSLLGFNRELSEPVTGYYLLGNGYRAFNPVLMRFNGPDSISPFGKGGLNTYAYCLGDPRNLKDPTGHSVLKALIETTQNLIANSNVGGLIEMQSNINTLITKKRIKNFKQLHSTTVKEYNDLTGVDTLKNLGLKKVQAFPEESIADLPRSLKIEIKAYSNKTPDPAIVKAKNNLDVLNRAAIRDESGAITNYKVLKLRPDHRNTIINHPNQRRPKQLLLKIDAAINAIRSS